MEVFEQKLVLPAKWFKRDEDVSKRFTLIDNISQAKHIECEKCAKRQILILERYKYVDSSMGDVSGYEYNYYCNYEKFSVYKKSWSH